MGALANPPWWAVAGFFALAVAVIVVAISPPWRRRAALAACLASGALLLFGLLSLAIESLIGNARITFLESLGIGALCWYWWRWFTRLRTAKTSSAP